MKKFKKLIPALCMLLVSAVMLGTTTFAWFSMNTSVKAGDMQIAAKTNDTYLLISATKTTATEIQTDKKITADLGMNNPTSLNPAAPCLTPTDEGYLTTNGKKVGGEAITTAGVKITDKATAEAVTNWYTAQATAASNAAINAETARQLTSFDTYVVEKTVYLTVAQGVNNANHLRVTPKYTALTAGKDMTGVKVLVVVTYADNTSFVTTLTSTSTTVNLYADSADKQITDKGVATVSLFIYYDGNAEAVYTNNAANLSGAKVEFTFDVDTVE